MKITKYIALALFALFAAVACSTDIGHLRISEDVDAPVLYPHESIIFTENNIEENTYFVWKAADFGFQANVEYVLWAQLATPSNNPEFADSVRVGSSRSQSISVANKEFTISMEDLGIESDTPTDIQLYLTASVGEAYKTVKSNPINLTVTTMDTDKSVLDYLYVVGNFQGWKPGNENTLAILEPQDRDGNYSGFVPLIGQNNDPVGFKFIGQVGGYDPFQIGARVAMQDGLNDLVTSSAKDISVDNGFYLLGINIATVTCTQQLKIENVGIVGDAVGAGWNPGTPEPLTWDSNDIYKFKGIVTFGSGKYKITVNGNWDISFGTDPDNLEFSGGSDNIPAPAPGTYEVVLDLRKRPWTVTLTQQ